MDELSLDSQAGKHTVKHTGNAQIFVMQSIKTPSLIDFMRMGT